jgi:hypothetical protein
MGVPEIDREAAAALGRISEEELKGIFLETGTGTWEDSRGPSGSTCLANHIYKNSGEELQTKIKNAVVKAISEWDPNKNKKEYLFDLACVAALTKMVGAAPGLIRHVDSKHILNNYDNVDHEDDTILSVIVGFPPNEQIRSALERWYVDEHFPWQAIGLICVGLLENEPENIESFLPKLLKTLDEHPDYFRVDLIGWNLDREAKKKNVDLENILRKFTGKYRSAQYLIDQRDMTRDLCAKD